MRGSKMLRVILQVREFEEPLIDNFFSITEDKSGMIVSL